MEPPVPLSEWMESYLYHHRALDRSPKTIRHYQATFKLFATYLETQGLAPDSRVLTTDRLQHFATWLRETPIAPRRGRTQRTPVGVFGILKDLKAFLRWLNAEGLLERSVKVPVPRLPETLFPILSDAELERVFTSRYMTGRSPLATRHRALIGLMLDTGLRREEVARLTLDSVSLERRRLTVVGKGNRERQMVFSPTVRDYLKQFLAIRGIDDEPLFHLTAAGIRTTFHRIQEAAGLEKFHPHQLRHQFATTMLREGTQLEVIGVMLGHEDYNTTRQYLSLDETDIARAHEAASPFESLLHGTNAVRTSPRRRHRYSAKEPVQPSPPLRHHSSLAATGQHDKTAPGVRSLPEPLAGYRDRFLAPLGTICLDRSRLVFLGFRAKTHHSVDGDDLR